MWKLVGLQWSMGLLISALLLVVSQRHALSGLWGVVAVGLPSTLFALRLSLGHRTPIGGVATFLAGELLKVAATLCLLALAARLYPSLVWWAMMAGLVAALKSYFLAFFLK